MNLRSIIQKALDNGWKELDTIHLKTEQFNFGLGHNELMAVVFSHSFAKSLFGKEWKKCLKKLVIQGKPLEYLTKTTGGVIKLEPEKKDLIKAWNKRI